MNSKPRATYYSLKSGFLSFCYRHGRSAAVSFVCECQKRQHRVHDLEDVIEFGDRVLRLLPRFAFSFPIPEGIGVDLYDLRFPSPLILAAFKGDLEVLHRWLTLGLGAVTMKTVMANGRDGNPRPRIQELPGGNFLNAMGLPCPGVNKKIQELERALRNGRLLLPGRPLGISIGGNSLDEYRSNFEQFRELFERHQAPHYFEINISCPNTPEGQDMVSRPGLLKELLHFMRQKSSAVFVVKLSPDMSDGDILRFADLAGECGKTALNLGNTQYRSCEQAGLPREAIAVGGGGFSGPALYPRTLEMTKLAAQTGIKIIATGGIDSADKVLELKRSGATLMGMASAVVKDMYTIPRINAALASGVPPQLTFCQK